MTSFLSPVHLVSRMSLSFNLLECFSEKSLPLLLREDHVSHGLKEESHHDVDEDDLVAAVEGDQHEWRVEVEEVGPRLLGKLPKVYIERCHVLHSLCLVSSFVDELLELVVLPQQRTKSDKPCRLFTDLLYHLEPSLVFRFFFCGVVTSISLCQIVGEVAAAKLIFEEVQDLGKVLVRVLDFRRVHLLHLKGAFTLELVVELLKVVDGIRFVGVACAEELVR